MKSDKPEPTLVFPFPELSLIEEAKAQLLSCAAQLHLDALDHHAQAMALTKQASKLESLLDVMADEDVVFARDQCVESGLIEVISHVVPGGDA